jgi:GT2 family glycosyltransferase
MTMFHSLNNRNNTSDVSVILVVWNSADYLSQCLAGLSRQLYKNFEVILIDNGSTDDALAGIDELKIGCEISIRKLPSNLGFAAANNMGAKLAKGKWIVFLNADAFPESGWLENLLKAVELNPQYTAFSSRQIQYNAPHLLDGAGDVYHISGLAWRNDYNMPVNAYGLAQREIFSPCAAAALYSREEFLIKGGFDEDYFSYFEDVDLGFRLRLMGAKSLYVPDAVVQHVGSASTGKRSNFSVYYGYRNMIWTFIKDMPYPYIWFFLPLHVSVVLFFAFFLTLRGQGKAIWSAILDALRGLPKILEKRRSIQKEIKIPPRELLSAMSVGLFEPYTAFISRNRSK